MKNFVPSERERRVDAAGGGGTLLFMMTFSLEILCSAKSIGAVELVKGLPNVLMRSVVRAYRAVDPLHSHGLRKRHRGRPALEW
jgi:hypothetical protein